MKCIVIYNPYSKKGKFDKYINYIKTVLNTKFETVDFVKTSSQFDAVQLAKDSCGKYDEIVAVGGDGKINQVVSGIAENPAKPKIAIIPAGTCNDTARSLGISMNIKKATLNALNGQENYKDVMRVNNGYCVYVLIFGYCAKSVYQTKAKLKKILGWFAYFFKGIKSICTHYSIPLKITADNEKFIGQYSFVLIYNSRSIAGIPVNPDATLDDGYVNMVLQKSHGKGFFNWIKDTISLIKIFLLGAKHLKNGKNMVVRKVKNISVLNPTKSVYNKDGDYGGNGNFDLTVLHDDVCFLAPKKKK